MLLAAYLFNRLGGIVRDLALLDRPTEVAPNHDQRAVDGRHATMKGERHQETGKVVALVVDEEVASDGAQFLRPVGVR